MLEENLQQNIQTDVTDEDTSKKPETSYYDKLKPLRTYQGDVDNAITAGCDVG